MPAYAEIRRQEILKYLERTQTVAVPELAEVLGVSKVTIRADLDALAKDGKLRRTHGGAVSLARSIAPSIQDARINVNVEAKVAIARVAARFVKPNMSILVDTGTTGLELVRQLDSVSNITIVTADMTIADYVDRAMPNAEVIVLGGALRKRHRYTSGTLALTTLKMLSPDVSFICPTAVSLEDGFLTNHEAMGDLKASFLATDALRIVLMDSSKLAGSGLFKFGALASPDIIICEKDEKGQLKAALKDSKVKLLLADTKA